MFANSLSQQQCPKRAISDARITGMSALFVITAFKWLGGITFSLLTRVSISGSDGFQATSGQMTMTSRAPSRRPSEKNQLCSSPVSSPRSASPLLEGSFSKRFWRWRTTSTEPNIPSIWVLPIPHNTAGIPSWNARFLAWPKVILPSKKSIRLYPTWSLRFSNPNRKTFLTMFWGRRDWRSETPWYSATANAFSIATGLMKQLLTSRHSNRRSGYLSRILCRRYALSFPPESKSRTS